LLVAAAAGLYAIIVFKQPGSSQTANEAWSGIDVQLKRRSALVPNLVETVKGYAGHERSVMEMCRGQPRWSSGGWSGDNFGKAVSSSVASMSEAFASVEPASSGSSGFSGGGGSGGGGGGGVGGGWKKPGVW
jgi:hypothetical protein